VVERPVNGERGVDDGTEDDEEEEEGVVVGRSLVGSVNCASNCSSGPMVADAVAAGNTNGSVFKVLAA